MARGQETRERIVAAARQLFAQGGFDGTTTAAIAQAAGVAEGTIFRHFRTKAGIAGSHFGRHRPGKP
ncbi:MAG TPA: helix-turn-helix transcriptional regulator [Firmicutes bacterium]|nr:helix-turn-helix transcriptional regulator [Bacillota bacterium]